MTAKPITFEAFAVQIAQHFKAAYIAAPHSGSRPLEQCYVIRLSDATALQTRVLALGSLTRALSELQKLVSEFLAEWTDDTQRMLDNSIAPNGQQSPALWKQSILQVHKNLAETEVTIAVTMRRLDPCTTPAL